MASNRTTGVFVIGMHRSGTSATVLSLESLGLHLCSDSDRLREGQGNPDHGESLSVITENDSLLDLYNGSWLHPCIGSNWLKDEPVESRLASAKTAFTSAHPDEPWACKDPRLCLTLPFWEQALGSRHPVVIVIRHPLEIVKSLQQREADQDPHHPASYYLAVWERYMRSALVNAAHHPVYVLNYQELLSDPDGSSAALAKWLQRNNLPYRAAGRAPIDPALQHARAGAGLTGLTPDQRRLHKLLTSLSGPHRRLRAANLGRESPRTTALFGPGPDLEAAGYLALPAAQTLRRRLVQINPLVTRRSATIGFATATLLAAASIAIMQLTRLGHTAGVDSWATGQLLRVQLPTFSSLLSVSSTLSAKAYLDWGAIAATALLLVARKRSAAAALLLGLLVSVLVGDWLRGPSHDPAGFFADKAFRAAVLLGLLAYFANRLIESRLWRSLVAGFCLLLVLLTALSRVYLGIHYPSAVLASLMLGAAVVVMLVAAFEAVQKSPHRVPPNRRPASAQLTPHLPLDDIS